MYRLKRISKRALYYVRQGYSIASLPFVFVGYASSIYYLAIKNIPFLEGIFPNFSNFLIVAGITLPLLCGIIGYIYMKRSWLYKTDAEIQVEANPYSTIKIQPVSIPMYKILYKLALKEGHLDIANDLEVIIKMSEKK